MSEHIETSTIKIHIGQRKGVVIFIAGAALMLAMMLLGYSIEGDLQAHGMKALEARKDPIMGLVLLFAFGFPLGVVAMLAGALLICRENTSRVIAAIISGAIIISLAALVPAVFGRETGGVYFGTGGVLILVCMVVSFWYWAQYRATLSDTAKKAADFKALGYLCFGLAAWNSCGLASMPSFGLFPEIMLEQGMRPFAVGQAKAIMADFVLGWVFTAIGLYKAAK